MTGSGSGMSACHPAGATKISANVHNEWSPVALYHLCPMPLAAISQLVKCWYKQHQQTCRPLLFANCHCPYNVGYCYVCTSHVVRWLFLAY